MATPKSLVQEKGEKHSVMFVIVLGVAILLGVAGQLLLKEGVSQAGPLGLNFGLILVIFRPVVFSGFVLYGLSSILWLLVLSKVQLSIAYPMLAIGYILIVFASWIFLKEPLTAFKIIGSLVIGFGVFLISR